MSAISTKEKYFSIYHAIKEDILTGEYKINEKIPTGLELGSKYQASHLTIKKALDLLVAEGYIVRRRGSGTVVQDWSQQKRRRGHYKPLSGTAANYKGHVKSEIIHFSIETSDEFLSRKLAIEEGEFIYKIIRLRVIDDVPSIIEHTWMPIRLIPNLEIKHLEKSIYQYIKEVLKLKIGSSFVNIEGIRPDDLSKDLLKLSDTDFLLRVEQIAYLDDGRTFEYSTADHIPDEFEFETVLIASHLN